MLAFVIISLALLIARHSLWLSSGRLAFFGLLDRFRMLVGTGVGLARPVVLFCALALCGEFTDVSFVVFHNCAPL